MPLREGQIWTKGWSADEEYKKTSALTLICSASKWLYPHHSSLEPNILLHSLGCTCLRHPQGYSLASLSYLNKCELIQGAVPRWTLCLSTSPAWHATTSLSPSVPLPSSTVFHKLITTWHYLFIVHCLSPK